MNRPLIAFLPLIIGAAAGAQAPPPATPDSTTFVTESSRISRIVPGPGDRPQGLLLRNGTFVSLSPGLAERVVSSAHKSASVQVAGPAFNYEGSRSIEATTITIAGVSYNDAPNGPLAGPPAGGPGGDVAPPPPAPAPPPPPPLAGGRPGPPAPAPCGAPPPPARGQAIAPPPPPNAGNAPGPGQAAPTPPPPPDGAAPPVPPLAPGIPPTAGR